MLQTVHKPVLQVDLMAQTQNKLSTSHPPLSLSVSYNTEHGFALTKPAV